MSSGTPRRDAPPLPADTPPDLRHTVANRLNSVAIHALRRARVADPAAGLSPERLSLLSVLVYGGPAPLGRLAQVEQLTPPAITRAVDALERDGLVRRRPSREDRRSVIVSATAAGRRVMEQGRRRRVERLAALLEGMPDRDLKRVDAALAVLMDRVGPR